MNASTQPACQLIPWHAGHDLQTVRWLNAPMLRAQFGITTPVTAASHRQWRQAQDNLVAWAIEARGEHVGNLLLDTCPRHASAYLQIYIGDPAHQGQGLGKAAMRLALDMAFSTLALHRIWLHTRPDNLRAQALYRQLGFVEEGLERQSIRDNAHFIDQQRWSILASEWPASH